LLPLVVKQLIIHGVGVEALPIAFSRAYVDAARASDETVEFVELPQAGHMDFLDPSSEAHAALCAWLEIQIWGTGTPPNKTANWRSLNCLPPKLCELSSISAVRNCSLPKRQSPSPAPQSDTIISDITKGT